jgi:hypothetical protein
MKVENLKYPIDNGDDFFKKLFLKFYFGNFFQKLMDVTEYSSPKKTLIINNKSTFVL